MTTLNLNPAHRFDSQFSNPSVRLAQAKTDSAPTKPLNPTELMTKVGSAAAPDAAVFGIQGLLGKKASGFALINPLTQNVTAFLSLPGATQNTPFGPMTPVLVKNLGTGETQNGLGKSWPIGKGVVIFANIRGTTFPTREGDSVTFNLGAFGNASALPGSHPALNALRKSRVQTGAAYQGKITMKDGQLKATVSGVDVTSLLKGAGNEFAPSQLLNEGDRYQARLNNGFSYMQGANPYQVARSNNGLNHGDRLSAFGQQVEGVNEALKAYQIPTGIQDVTTNSQAGRVLSLALENIDKLPLSKQAMVGKALAFIKANNVEGLFTKDKGNEMLKQELPFVKTSPGDQFPPKEGGFMKKVLEGFYRQENIDPGALQKAADWIVGDLFGSPTAGPGQDTVLPLPPRPKK